MDIQELLIRVVERLAISASRTQIKYTLRLLKDAGVSAMQLNPIIRDVFSLERTPPACENCINFYSIGKPPAYAYYCDILGVQVKTGWRCDMYHNKQDAEPVVSRAFSEGGEDTP